MKPTRLSPKVLSWAVDLEDQAQTQAIRSAELPFVAGYVALMPDAHWGMGATIGSVIPTVGAIVPSAVGVDIGCGMVAAQLSVTGELIKDHGTEILERISQSVPAGLGKWRAHDDRRDEAFNKLADAQLTGPAITDYAKGLSVRPTERAADQLGTLGSGNHFIEICEDEAGIAWVVLHSGSRGIGNQLARHHIDTAKGVMEAYFIELEDPDLAYLVEGTPEFEAYIHDLLWAQKYALLNREWMTDLVIEAVDQSLPQSVHSTWVINCHHNYAEMEHHHGKNMWVTRKGAIRAREGDYGVIPGSMGTGSFVVKGKGNPASYTSAAHGAGRKMSRRKARESLTVESLAEKMGDKTWLNDQATQLLDEHPDSYKDLGAVMEAQSEMVEPVHQLTTVLNYKGV